MLVAETEDAGADETEDPDGGAVEASESILLDRADAEFPDAGVGVVDRGVEGGADRTTCELSFTMTIAGTVVGLLLLDDTALSAAEEEPAVSERSCVGDGAVTLDIIPVDVIISLERVGKDDIGSGMVVAVELASTTAWICSLTATVALGIVTARSGAVLAWRR